MSVERLANKPKHQVRPGGWQRFTLGHLLPNRGPKSAEESQDGFQGSNELAEEEGESSSQGGRMSGLLNGLMSGLGLSSDKSGKDGQGVGDIGKAVSEKARSAASGTSGSQRRKLLEASFDRALHKLENAPKKAKKKIDEQRGVERVEEGKKDSLKAEDEAQAAEDQSKKAQEELGAEGEDPTKALQAQAAAGKKLNSKDVKRKLNNGPLERKLKQFKDKNKRREKVDDFQEGGLGGAPSDQVGRSSSLPELHKAMDSRKEYGDRIDGRCNGLRQCHGAQSEKAAKFGKQVDGLGKMEDAFGGKEKAHATAQKAYKKASQGLAKAAQALGQVSKIMMQVAKTLQGVAKAVKPIPFVGPALAASIMKVAKVVQMIGKGLGMLAKMLGQAAKKKANQAQAEGQFKDHNKAKKLEATACKANAKNHLDEAKNKQEGYEGEKESLEQKRQENLDRMNRIAELMKEKGQDARVDGGGGDDPLEAHRNQQRDRKALKRRTPLRRAPQSRASKPQGNDNARQAAGARSAAARPKGKADAGGGTQEPGREVAAVGSPEQALKAMAGNGAQAGGGQQQSGGRRDKDRKGSDKGQKVTPSRLSRTRKKKRRKDRRLRVEEQQNKSLHVQRDARGEERKRLEDKLKGLADEIKSSREERSGSSGLKRRGAQRKLALAYNTATQKKVPIGREIDSLVRQQMKDAPDRLAGRAQIAEEQPMSSQDGQGRGREENLFAKRRRRDDETRKRPQLALNRFSLFRGQQDRNGHHSQQQEEKQVQALFRA